MHPEATVRPWATCQVVAGDALALASGLGYIQRTQVYRRGYVFRRGPLVIQMSQQESVRLSIPILTRDGKWDLMTEQANMTTGEPMAAHPDTPWQVEVKTASPVRNTQEMPLSKYVDAVVEVQQLMKVKQIYFLYIKLSQRY
jgi:mediator of RNA polymerase II transcription subunit 18